MTKLYFGILLILGLSACSDADNLKSAENDAPIGGPCVVINREPVIKIQNASEVSTREDISTVEITNIFFNGDAIAFSENHQTLITNIEIDYDSDSLTCSLPCAFLQQEGLYEFTVSANGYESETIEVQASYSVFEGGCPSYLDLGTDVYIELAKDN